MNFEKGEVLLLNKPQGWTSFDVVKKVRYLTKVRKVGHAGTLDPLATGLLIVCTGKMTKEIDQFQAAEKEYTGSIRLGMTTPCYDLEQPADHNYPIDHITNAMILEKVQQFTGVISQYPPPHSAVKIGGKRAYKLARQGVVAEMKSREVEVKLFEITDIQLPSVFFRIICSKGTYIRSIANDFGKALDSGGCLELLCRTRIGIYKIQDAMELNDFINKVQDFENQIDKI